MPLMKSENPILHNFPSAPKAYFLAARPKTWIASLSPVFMGAVIAPEINFVTLLLTAAFSLLIQIGTNYANDYFDFVNGADSQLRNGPKRATLEGWVKPQSMLLATFLAFFLAVLVALPLMISVGPWSFFLAALCVLFGVLYTGGPKPLGYLGLGELLVFVFFGPIATCGSYFLQTGSVYPAVLLASVAPGLLSGSLLIANNLRDEKSDRIAQKNTLIVRFGKHFGSWEYTLSLLLSALIPFLLVIFYGAPLKIALSSCVFLFSLPSIRTVFRFRDPLELIAVLQNTALVFFLYTLAFCALLLC